MGVGPNYVLAKGLLATGTTAYQMGELVTLAGDGTSVARATTANSGPVFVCQEDMDTTRLATGKVFIGVQMLGIARVIAGGAVAVGASVVNNTNARAVAAAPATGATVPVFGVALTAAAADGDYIDVLLTPGARSAAGA